MENDLSEMFKKLRIQARLDVLYDQFSYEAALILSGLRKPVKDLKVKNPVAYYKLQALAAKFKTDMEGMIQQVVSQAYEAAERRNDNILMRYIKAAGVVLAGHMLLKIFNRISGDPAGVTLDNIVTLTRNREAYNQFVKNNLRLSARVWKITRQNLKQIEMYTASGLAQGRSAASISRDLKKFLRNPDARFRRVRDPETGKLQLSIPAKAYHPGQGVYRSSFKNAFRLARTETNMAYRRADLARWRNIDFITGYEVRLSDAHPEPDICNSMAGKYPKNFTFVGWHPHCWCHSVPVMLPQDKFVDYINSGKMPAHDKVKGIPPKAFNYVRDRSDKLSRYKTPPFFLENFTLKHGTFYPKKILY